MLYTTLLIFSLVIGMVPFSVALNSSVYRCIGWKETVRMAFFFALFQSAMTATGWGIGYGLRGLFYDLKIPVALFLMLFIAIRLFLDSWKKNREIRIVVSGSMRLLISFGIVTSINPFLLGISLGIIYPGILVLAGSVFGAAFLLTVLGVRIGKLGVMKPGRIAELAAAVALFCAGILILLQYLKLI